MAQALGDKAIPSSYERVYGTVCPNDENRIATNTFLDIAAAAKVKPADAKQAWHLADLSRTGAIDKQGLFHALALLALAQQGSEVSTAEIEFRQELPPIKIDNLASLQSVAQDASKFGDYTYRELEDSEFIQVSLAKSTGMLKKHNNYSVFSKRNNATVVRRYSDFEPLDTLLRKKYPFRISPILPPKTFGGGNKKPEFVEKRRRGLQRYLTFIGRHPGRSRDRRCCLPLDRRCPCTCFKSLAYSCMHGAEPYVYIRARMHAVLRSDEVVIAFLTEETDIQTKLKELGKSAQDEYFSSPVAMEAAELVPDDMAGRIAGLTSELPNLLEIINHMRELAVKLVDHTEGLALLWRDFAEQLKLLGATPSGYMAGESRWQEANRYLKDVSNLMGAVADRGDEQRLREEDGILDNLHAFHEVLLGFKELLARRAKGVVKEMGTSSRRQSQERRSMSRLDSTSSVDSAAKAAALQAKMSQTDAAIDQLTLMNNFSIYCVFCESKLIRAFFTQIGVLLEELASTQATGHKQLTAAWQQVMPLVEDLVKKLDVTGFKS
eukprot:TRINITY_DN10675_c0_g1_i6.p1 TRINITY_DN10675_c0_g1~~TRINITY_DN10675_c0_g1_i6.p1  ORF type:complete len:550 (+),score=133.41 TRINITY_DN10675_c0_g1_i6:88-1737(+)